jgi:hypothetical protein
MPSLGLQTVITRTGEFLAEEPAIRTDANTLHAEYGKDNRRRSPNLLWSVMPDGHPVVPITNEKAHLFNLEQRDTNARWPADLLVP